MHTSVIYYFRLVIINANIAHLWNLDGVSKNKRLMMNQSPFIYTCPSSGSDLEVDKKKLVQLLEVPLAYYRNVLRDSIAVPRW